jgi:hypothetical protein
VRGFGRGRSTGRSLPSHGRPTLIPRGDGLCGMDLSSFVDVDITASGAGPQTPKVGYVRNPSGPSTKVRTAMGGQICAPGKSGNLKGRISTLPHPPDPKEKPARLKRRARDLHRRGERGTEAPRPCSRAAFLHRLSTGWQQQIGDEA